MTRDSKSRMAAIQYKTVNPQLKAMTQSDQLTMAEVLLSVWPKCQSERQDNGSDCETEWSEEEYSDWSDEEVSEMPPENKELWESFFNNSDPYNPFHFTCLPKVMALDCDHAAVEEEEPVPPCSQEKDNVERSEDEDSDWSDEGVSDEELSPEDKELWESFFNKRDPYNPLHSSCHTEVNLKTSEMKQNHTPLRPTASEVEEHNPGQSTKERAKKVTFSEEVTIHTLEAWGVESRAARDGSCWTEMARDRDRFRRRVEKAKEIISPCLTARHRATVLDRLLNHSNSTDVVH